MMHESMRQTGRPGTYTVAGAGEGEVHDGIIVRDLCAGYGRGMPDALSALSLTLPAGQLAALVGPNGCGKSTLLKAIMGFVPVRSGSIMLEGISVQRLGRRRMSRLVAYMPQDVICPEYATVGDIVEMAAYGRHGFFGGPDGIDRGRFREALDAMGLRAHAGTAMSILSGGQRQRAWIAMALAQDSSIILLDEPVNHLDMKYQYAVLGLLGTLARDRGKTILLVLHDLNLAAAFADRLVMMKEGGIVTVGVVHRVMTADVIRSVYGVNADVFERNGRWVCLPAVQDSVVLPSCSARPEGRARGRTGL